MKKKQIQRRPQLKPVDHIVGITLIARSGGDALQIRESVGKDMLQRVQDQVIEEQEGKQYLRCKQPVLPAKLEMHKCVKEEEVEEEEKENSTTTDMSWIDDIPMCPVFYPTMEEFEDPLSYIRSIAPQAQPYGICKILSPVTAAVPAGAVLMKEKVGFKFQPRVQPLRLANWDFKDKITFLMSGRHYSFCEYEKMANKFFTRKFNSSAMLPYKFLEAEFWKEITSGRSCNIEYGCDIEGSAFSNSSMDPLGTSKWNLKVLPHLSNSILRLLETSIPGVTEPMMYIGMLFSMFAWHVEDHYLYSINYHHCGASKTWYGVPGHAATAFEKVVQEAVYDAEMLVENGVGAAYDLLIGKTTMFPPNLLTKRNVPVYRAVQAPGEFVITFPRAYHAGFSHGFNCGEAVNFAMADWLQFGAAACKRYELLNRPPLLPHEELLCKEAMNVAEMRSCADNCVQKLASEQQHAVKVAFVRLMRSQHQVCWLLKKRGSQTIFTSPGFNTSVTCALCKHMSYVAFVTCRCTVEGPICLNHAQEIRNCTCGISRSVVMREGLLEMEAAAQRFEREEGILEDALKEPSIKYGTHMNELGLEELMFDSEDYSGYKPYGDLMIERAERHAISSDVSSADVKGANIPKYIPGRLKTLVNSQDNSGLATTMNAAHSISIVPQATTEDATGPSWSDDGKEVVQMQSFQSAQSQAGGPILEQTNSNEVLEGRDTESFLLLKTLQGDADNNCQCSAEKMVCFCERKHIPTVIPGAKRKRSGLVTRTMPVVKVQISQSKESLSKVLSSTVGASQCASIKVENDNSHHVKRQRMASLEKIRFEHGTSVASPKPQEKTLLARVVNDCGKDPSGEKKVGRKKGCPRVLQTPKGGVLLLQDIIRELNIKAALNEVLSDWQFKAQRKGLDLQFLFVQCPGIGGPQKEGRKLPALTLKGCQQVKSMLTSKKGGRLEKLLEGTFGSATEEVEAKQSSKMSCIESEEFSVQKKQKLINCPEKGGSDFPEQHGAHEISEEVDESLRRRPIVYKAVPVNLSTHIFRQPPAVTQVPKVPAPSQPVADGKFQDVTVLACERLPYHLSLKSAASQHCRQQSQWSTCISELRPADSDNAHRNKVLSVRKSSSAKENGQLLSKRLESNINSVCNATHFNVMDTMSNSGVAHEVQTILLGDKNCSKMLLSSKISVAKSVITQLDGQGSKPELCLPEVGFSAESSVKVHNGHAVKKKLLKKHKKEGSVSAQAVQLAPGHTVSCQRTGDLSRGPDLEHVKKCCRQSGLPLVRIKVKGPQMQEPDSNKLTSDQKIMKVSAQNLILANAPTSSLTSSAVDEGFNRNSNVLEEQCLRKDSAQVAIKDPGRPKSHPSAILQHSEIEAGKRFLGEIEQQKTSILDTDLPSDDRHTLPPKEAGEGGEQCEKVPGLSTDVEKVGDQVKHSPFVPAFSLKDVEVCDNDREGGCAREAHVSPDQALREVYTSAKKDQVERGVKQEKDVQILDETERSRNGTGMLPGLELCRKILHSSMQDVLNTEILQSMQWREQTQQQQKQDTQIWSMDTDQQLKNCAAPSESSFIPMCLEQNPEGLTCSKELSQVCADTISARETSCGTQAALQKSHSDRVMESMSVAMVTSNPSSVCHSSDLCTVSGVKLGDAGIQLQVHMQPVDGAFDKIGGVSSGSAGKTQEASRQPAEVVKCNQVKNQVSMEIAHPQAAHLQAAQAFWGRLDQLTPDVGQAGTMQAFLHLFGGLPQLDSLLPVLEVGAQHPDTSYGHQWQKCQALVPNNIHGSSRTDIDALETGHMHGVTCSQALVREDHIATSQVCGSQGMEAPIQCKQQTYSTTSSNCETACLSSWERHLQGHP